MRNQSQNAHSSWIRLRKVTVMRFASNDRLYVLARLGHHLLEAKDGARMVLQRTQLCHDGNASSRPFEMIPLVVLVGKRATVQVPSKNGHLHLFFKKYNVCGGVVMPFGVRSRFAHANTLRATMKSQWPSCRRLIQWSSCFKRGTMKNALRACSTKMAWAQCRNVSSVARLSGVVARGATNPWLTLMCAIRVRQTLDAVDAW